MDCSQQQHQLCRSSVILDLQCFKDNSNDYVVKEASVIDVCTGTLLLHHIARPPFDRDFLSEEKLRESYWLTKHCHGIDWNHGDIPYYALIDKLCACLNNQSVVYVKGLEKKKYIMKYLITNNDEVLVVDMADIGCGSLSTIGNLLSTNTLRCGQHKSVQHRCALVNCTLLRGWLLLTAKETHCGSCYCCCSRHNNQHRRRLGVFTSSDPLPTIPEEV
jgi:hypothetical protein